MCNFENKTRLDDALLEQIRSVANGNHVQDYEIIKKGSRTFDLDLSLLFFWEFHGKKTITRQAGGKPSKKHLESEEFDQYIEEQIKFAANDRKIRANFLNMLRSTILNNHTINDYNQQHTIKLMNSAQKKHAMNAWVLGMFTATAILMDKSHVLNATGWEKFIPLGTSGKGAHGAMDQVR